MIESLPEVSWYSCTNLILIQFVGKQDSIPSPVHFNSHTVSRNGIISMPFTGTYPHKAPLISVHYTCKPCYKNLSALPIVIFSSQNVHNYTISATIHCKLKQCTYFLGVFCSNGFLQDFEWLVVFRRVLFIFYMMFKVDEG